MRVDKASVIPETCLRGCVQDVSTFSLQAVQIDSYQPFCTWTDCGTDAYHKGAINAYETEADAFWPTYKRYETTLLALNDAKIALIKDYAEHYETMTNAKAKILRGSRILELSTK